MCRSGKRSASFLVLIFDEAIYVNTKIYLTKKLIRLITGTNILKTDMPQLILVFTGVFFFSEF